MTRAELCFTLQLNFKLKYILLKIAHPRAVALRQQQQCRPRSCRFAAAGYATCGKLSLG